MKLAHRHDFRITRKIFEENLLQRGILNDEWQQNMEKKCVMRWEGQEKNIHAEGMSHHLYREVNSVVP